MTRKKKPTWTMTTSRKKMKNWRRNVDAAVVVDDVNVIVILVYTPFSFSVFFSILPDDFSAFSSSSSSFSASLRFCFVVQIDIDFDNANRRTPKYRCNKHTEATNIVH